MTSCHMLDKCWRARVTQCLDLLRWWKRMVLPRYIPDTWLVFPDLVLRPRTKHSAVLETLGHMVHYIITAQTELTLLDYMETVKRTKREVYKWKGRSKTYGNYLDLWRWQLGNWEGQIPYPGRQQEHHQQQFIQWYRRFTRCRVLLVDIEDKLCVCVYVYLIVDK